MTCRFFFPCSIFVLFYCNDGLIEWVRKYPLSLSLLKDIVENWFNFFLKFWVELTIEPNQALYFGSNLFIRYRPIQTSVFSYVSLAHCFFQVIGPSHLGYQICEHILVHDILVLSCCYPVNFHWIFNSVPSFVSDINNLCYLGYFNFPVR